MCFWMLDVFADTPTGNQRGPPSTRFARAEQKLHPSASPLWGEAGWKKDKLQNQVYTGRIRIKLTRTVFSRALVP